MPSPFASFNPPPMTVRLGSTNRRRRSLLPSVEDGDAQDYNDQQQAQADDWNARAAQANLAQRQAQAQAAQVKSAADFVPANAEYNRATLAAALGYHDPKKETLDKFDRRTQSRISSKLVGRPPGPVSMGQLQSDFFSRTVPERVAIYKAGGASFLDADDTGINMLQGFNKDQEDSAKAGINDIGGMIAKGQIIFENDANGVPRPFQITTDPDNPMLPKTKVPLSRMQLHHLNEGMKRKMIPDIDQFRPQLTTQATTAGDNPRAAALAAKLAGRGQQFGPTRVDFELGQGVNPTATKLREEWRSQDEPNRKRRDDYNTKAMLQNTGADVVNSGVSVLNMLKGGANNTLQLFRGSTDIDFPYTKPAPYAPWSAEGYHPEDDGHFH